MKKTLQRGFTLIELLVVIAIIGILAAVVLASLSDARSGGQNASIQQTMASMRTQAEVYYNNAGNFSYTGVCADATTVATISAALNVVNGPAYVAADDTNTVATNDIAAEANRKAMCNANASSYQITVPIAGSTGFWCIDSAGGVGETAASPAVGAVTCP